MNKYEFTSAPLGCDVTVTYKDGRLFGFEACNADFDLQKSLEKRYHLFFTEAEFLSEIKKHSIKVTKVTIAVTFDQFYEKYAHKVAKHEGRKAWDKLSKKDQLEAYYFIPAYESFIKLNQHAKLYPASYLNAKRWIR